MQRKKGQKLGQKNLSYSMLLAGVLLLFLVIYMMYMLPSLYVDHIMESNLESIKQQHMEYVKTGSYEHVQVKNPVACFSVKIPKEGDTIYIVGKQFSLEITAKDNMYIQLLDDFRAFQESYVNDGDNEKEEEQFKQTLSDCLEKLKDSSKDNPGVQVSGEFSNLYENKDEFQDEYTNYHKISDQLMIIETGISDGINDYTTYLAMENEKDALILSVLPAMQPQMDEIRPVVLGSLPMIAVVILLLVLLFSQIYSRGIVEPIEGLVCHTKQMKNASHFTVSPMPQKWKSRSDEVGTLAETMDDLYLKIEENYEALEQKNEQLAEENKRQETFLRASSHQLKTPISAALLLLDGMINGIGKYKDTKKYLSEVKKQLLSMRKMVEEILYLNHCGDEIHMIPIEIREFLTEIAKKYQVVAQNKKLEIAFLGVEEVTISSDVSILTQILDNLWSNAINYTPDGAKIEVICFTDKIEIRNYGSKIPEEILPDIFEPFVTGNQDTKAHGLGLYLVSYYAKKVGIQVVIENEADAVLTVVVFPK